MRPIFLLTILFCQAFLVSAQSPGGVATNLRLWFKANAGVYENDGTNTAEDGDGVRNWDDASPSDNDAENPDASTSPIFRTGVTNGNAALEFDGTKFLDTNTFPGIGDDESFNFFLVFKQNSFVAGGNDAVGTFIIDRQIDEDDADSYNPLASFKIVDTDKYFYQRRDEDGNNLGGPTSVTPANTTSFVLAQYYRREPTSNSYREGIYLNGALDIDQASLNIDIPAPITRIGRHATELAGGLNGYFAEMIVYDRHLSDAERNRVQSYLAIKYGITLDPSTNYVRRDGTVIYPSTGSHSGYATNIAGIGRDNAAGAFSSAFIQTSSQSQNAGSIVRISNASSLSNNDFLVWGSNGGTLTVPSTSDVPMGIDAKLSRVWRVAETGNVGTISVTVDLSSVPGNKRAQDIRLLVDANGTFATGATAYQVSSSSGSTYTFDDVDIADDYYFTIGTVNDVETPLPIELTKFDVHYENPAVVATWETASELNNDYFTLERAGADLIFESVAKIPGAGTSKVPRAYTTIDLDPYGGRSYYRLKQTDVDSSFTYSEVKTIVIEKSPHELSVFPNPSDGKKLKFMFGNTRFDLSYIQINNKQGKLLESAYFSKKGLREYSTTLKKQLAPGMYILKVHYNGKDEFLKLIVI